MTQQAQRHKAVWVLVSLGTNLSHPQRRQDLAHVAAAAEKQPEEPEAEPEPEPNVIHVSVMATYDAGTDAAPLLGLQPAIVQTGLDLTVTALRTAVHVAVTELELVALSETETAAALVTVLGHVLVTYWVVIEAVLTAAATLVTVAVRDSVPETVPESWVALVCVQLHCQVVVFLSPAQQPQTDFLMLLPCSVVLTWEQADILALCQALHLPEMIVDPWDDQSM